MQEQLLMGDTDAWRCDHCAALVYNLDRDGRPAPGAPKPLYLSRQYQNVCMTCFQLGIVIRDSGYWKAQHDAYYERLKKAMGGDS